MTKLDKTDLSIDSEDKAEKNVVREKKSSGNGLVLLLMLVIVGSAISAGYYLWDFQQKQSGLIQQQQISISELEEKISAISEEFLKSLKTSESNVKQILVLTNQMQQVESISQRAMTIVNRSQRDWVLAEIDYLLRIAHQRIAVAKDIKGAIAALKGADARLKQLGDLKLFVIRKQLAKDIASLSAIYQADVNGISLALDQMIAYLPNLPFKSVKDEIKIQLNENNAVVKPKVEDKTFVDSVIETVKQIGDIKVHQRSIETASTAQQQSSIEQLLRTYLLGARLAALRFNQTQFLHEVNQAAEIVRLHYDVKDNRVIQLQKTLLSYSALQLNPDLPELTKAWELLQVKTTSSTRKTIRASVSKPVSKAPSGIEKVKTVEMPKELEVK